MRYLSFVILTTFLASAQAGNAQTTTPIPFAPPPLTPKAIVAEDVEDKAEVTATPDPEDAPEPATDVAAPDATDLPEPPYEVALPEAFAPGFGPASSFSGTSNGSSKVWLLASTLWTPTYEGFDMSGSRPAIEALALVYEDELWSKTSLKGKFFSWTYGLSGGVRYKHQLGTDLDPRRSGVQGQAMVRTSMFIGPYVRVQGGVTGIFGGGRTLSEFGADAGIHVNYDGIYVGGDLIWAKAFDEQVYRNIPRLRVGLRTFQFLGSHGLFRRDPFAKRYSFRNEGTDIVWGLEWTRDSLADLHQQWYAEGKSDKVGLFLVAHMGGFGLEASYQKMRHKFEDYQGTRIADNTLPSITVAGWYSIPIHFGKKAKSKSAPETLAPAY